MRVRSFFAFAIFLAVPAFAIAQMDNMEMEGPMLPSGVANGATGALLKAHRDMMTAMHVALTGNPDRDFVVMMIPHHQGAIDMARVQLEYGTDPEIRAMAEEIIAAQEAEIAEFEAWLAAHPE
ncbi:MAG: DUF305 domain-containing protein [Bauldia sp.]|nr:DUF305 domain-containing protein [Bauldia sp.]